MFLKDVWSDARLSLYCELHYRKSEGDLWFDPEFPVIEPQLAGQRLCLGNLNVKLHWPLASAAITPTHCQADSYPPAYRDQISVIHDGIDTKRACPNPEAALVISSDLTLTRNDEVISFINRNLEPSRGYHKFMRVLPDILRARPQAQVVVLGGDGVSYGAAPPGGESWKQLYIDEVRDDISDADWARVHFLGRVPYDSFVSLL